VTAQTDRPRGSILGTRVRRVEDPEFLTTGAVYTEDLHDERLAGALRLTVVRSPIAHARIVSIDTAAALESPGCVAVFTADDLSGAPAQRPILPMYPAEMAQPLLARDVVCFVGQPVVAVLTEERYQGEDAAELVDVEYDPLPPVIDPRDAAAGETLLFPDVGSNVAYRGGELAADDPFADCEVIVRQDVVNQRVAVAPLEVRAGAAAWGDDDRLTAWVPNQGAQGTQGMLARMLGLDRGQVRVITPAVGGAFGAKFGADPEHALVGWLARELRRPVTWVETRSENMVAMTHGRAQVQTLTIGGSRDGRVRAYRIEVLQDSGAYPRFGALLPSLTLLMAPGVYDIEHVDGSFVSVVTTTTPVGAYRGAGRPEATAAIERAMDLFAAEIGMDPAEVRRRNLLPAFAEPYRSKGGALYDSGDYPAALATVLQAAGYDELRAEQQRRRERDDTKQLGIGLSVYVEITGGGDESGPRRRTPRSRSIPTALPRSSPARHRTGRATPRFGRCWQVTSSASLSTESR
jgi:carbon-monoxide dehydrogenase large subunit